MFVRNGMVVTSASDLTAASTCEFAFARAVDVKLGRVEGAPATVDGMLERAARLGDEHEARVLQVYRERFGNGVVEVERPDVHDPGALDVALERTRRAFADGADVVFQAAFFDGRSSSAFLGFADFIVRQPDGRYLVQDTKLARSARVTALLQLAAYVEQLAEIGVEPADEVELLLGDGSVSTHRTADILPVYRNRLARLRRIVDARLAADGPAAWGVDGDRDAALGLIACGRCDECAAQVEATGDVLLVAGVRGSQRLKLDAAGIRTIDDLAASEGAVDGIGADVLARLRTQARLQLQAVEGEPPPFELVDAHALSVLPEPDDGDIFFDFEGDPLYTEGPGNEWGLDYLFGLVGNDERYVSFWAHDFAAERIALREFLDFVAERRGRYPGLHIYHYASYERTHLLSIAARHTTGEDEVDQLLREHVFVDLYPVVRRALRVGSRSYSIKKLEPLYMGDELRTAEVTTGAASITEYVAARELLRAPGHEAEGRRKLDDIADYNRYDCVSTRRLRDWMRGLAIAAGVTTVGPERAQGTERTRHEVDVVVSPLGADLLELAGSSERSTDAEPGSAVAGHAPAEPTTDQTVAALASAAIDYHRREDKSFWWDHFFRLAQPVSEWADTRDVLVVVRAEVARDWFRESGGRVDRRHVRLWGQLGPGSRMEAGAKPYALYEQPAPFDAGGGDPGSRACRVVTIIEARDEDGSFLVDETLPKNTAAYDHLPVALTPGPPPRAGTQQGAIEEWGQAIVDARRAAPPSWPKDAVVDLLRRVPPRTQSARIVAADASGSGLPADVVASLLDLDDSYIAVQGPPGTGKTYLGAHVISQLVREHHWKVGVVAQSHAVVENLLRAVVAAGLDRALVGKAAKASDAAAPGGYTLIEKNGHAQFAADRTEIGFVIGGTAWDHSNADRLPRRSLDLLVIEEAGQFSIAATIAASASARSLLLLGDPQQLPQVSQGLHPAPVDASALGWIGDGHDVLPPELGYFLAETRRMSPELTTHVSRLSYEGKLRANDSVRGRSLAGITAGLHPVPVEHAGNVTESREEAQRVVELVHAALGRSWSDSAGTRALTADDVIVVAPYNAQRLAVQDALTAAGLGAVRVGTVDKFQGQEAVIAIVTLAASSAADVPRGMSFLIMKNRLNVAISRAKWAAFLVHSPDLIEYLPRNPAGVAELSAFMRLVEDGNPESESNSGALDARRPLRAP